MIDLIKRLKSEKATLESTLGKWEGELHTLREERDLVSLRVGKMLEVLNHADAVGQESAP